MAILELVSQACEGIGDLLGVDKAKLWSTGEDSTFAAGN
jgi:hypothetical protein